MDSAVKDIVERLRRWAIATDAVPASDLMDEAADEIERLRRQRDFWLRQTMAISEHADNMRISLLELVPPLLHRPPEDR